jgi:hypothetical protein
MFNWLANQNKWRSEMKKQISAVEMVVVGVMAMLALIVVYSAGARLSAPDLPSIENSAPLNSSPVIGKNAQTSEAPAASSTVGEGTQRFRTVVVNPETGARLFEWQAPTVSRVETIAAPETAIAPEDQSHRTVVLNPETGARLFEWQAPTVSRVETIAGPETASAAEDQGHYRTVVINPETGARLFEWQAPTMSNTAIAKVPETR